MNLKKAKAIRRRIRQLVSMGHTFAPVGLVEVPHTKRTIGTKLPEGWTWPRLSRLLTIGGDWAAEAKKLIVPIQTCTMINAFGSKRAFYQEAKRRLG